MASSTIAVTSNSQTSQFGGTKNWSFQPDGSVGIFTSQASAFTMATISTSNYGFSIPAGSVIDGIEVYVVYRNPTNSGTYGPNIDYSGQINLTGATSKSYTYPVGTSSYTGYTLGGSTDLWGKSWTVSDINSSSFGMTISNTNSANTRATEMSTYQIKVYYTPYTTTTKTQDGKANISATQTKTQNGLATIAGTYELAGWGFSIPGITYWGDSPVAVQDVSYTRNQTGVANIRNTTQRTQLGKAAIRKTTTRTTTGRARLRKTVPRTITGRAAIRKTTTRAQTGRGRIQTTIQRNQLGQSRIQITTQRTITGQSRITLGVNRDQTGKADILQTVARDQGGVARITIETTVQRQQIGRAAIRRTTTQAITGVARVQYITTRTQLGKAAIRTVAVRDQIGVARIRKTVQQNQTGVARLAIQRNQTITGISRITLQRQRDIAGKAAIRLIRTRNQTGKGAIAMEQNRTITGVANITHVIDYKKPRIGIGKISVQIGKGDAPRIGAEGGIVIQIGGTPFKPRIAIRRDRPRGIQ